MRAKPRKTAAGAVRAFAAIRHPFTTRVTPAGDRLRVSMFPRELPSCRHIRGRRIPWLRAAAAASGAGGINQAHPRRGKIMESRTREVPAAALLSGLAVFATSARDLHAQDRPGPGPQAVEYQPELLQHLRQEEARLQAERAPY